MKIAVLYGTETGNAEMLAEDLAGELDGDHEVTCANLSNVDPAGFDPGTFYILVSSTYGDGDLPASAQPFAKAMEAKAPDLSGIHFAIFGLGDSEYHETFNGGGEKLAALMASRGAVQVGERVTHDASGSDMAEDLAFPWARAVIAQAASLVGEDA
jgi:MioC protein